MNPVRSKTAESTGKPLRQTSNGMYRKAEFCEFYKEMIRYAFKLISEDKVPYLPREGSLQQMQYEYRYA